MLVLVAVPSVNPDYAVPTANFSGSFLNPSGGSAFVKSEVIAQPLAITSGGTESCPETGHVFGTNFRARKAALLRVHGLAFCQLWQGLL